jgi:simple sugar transport system substrate-binding protein
MSGRRPVRTRRGRHLRRLGLSAAAALVAVAALSGCSGRKVSDDTSSSGVKASDITIAVVSHGKAGDTFWDIVKQGAQKAGSDLGVKVTYQGDGDPQRQAQLIDTAVSQKVDGLVVSMANPDALADSIRRAVAAGIPVITINSGEDRSAELGAITHIGQSERVAGEAAGTRLARAGVKHLVCVVHEAGNVGLEDRCAGAGETLGGTVTNLQVDVSDLADASAKIKATLQQDPSVDGVLTLNGGVAAAARDAIREAGSKATLATFDLNADVIAAIRAGQILFAVDQQPYLQGYLPVTFLYLYATNQNTVGGGRPVLTGPSFVTKDNVEQVAKLAEAGTR